MCELQPGLPWGKTSPLPQLQQARARPGPAVRTQAGQQKPLHDLAAQLTHPGHQHQVSDCTPRPVSPTCPTDLHGIYEMPLEFLHSECLSCWKKYIKKSVKEDFLKQAEFSFLCENLNSVSHRMWLTFFYNQNLFATVPRSKKVNTLMCSDVNQLPELNRFAI